MKPYLTIVFLFAVCFSHLSAQKFEPRGEKRNEIGVRIASLEGPSGPLNWFGFSGLSQSLPKIQWASGLAYRRYFAKYAFYSAISTHSSQFRYGEDYQCWDCGGGDFQFWNLSLRAGIEKYFRAQKRFQPFFTLGLVGIASKNNISNVEWGYREPFWGPISGTGWEWGIEGGMGSRYYFNEIISTQLQFNCNYTFLYSKVKYGFGSNETVDRYSLNGFMNWPSLQLSMNIAF